MKKVVLFSMDDEHIKVIIEAYFDATNSLIIEGYDIGPRVKEYWGDSDYEYSTTVYPQEVSKLYAALNLQPMPKTSSSHICSFTIMQTIVIAKYKTCLSN